MFLCALHPSEQSCASVLIALSCLQGRRSHMWQVKPSRHLLHDWNSPWPQHKLRCMPLVTCSWIFYTYVRHCRNGLHKLLAHVYTTQGRSGQNDVRVTEPFLPPQVRTIEFNPHPPRGTNTDAMWYVLLFFYCPHLSRCTFRWHLCHKLRFNGGSSTEMRRAGAQFWTEQGQMWS